MNTNYGTVEFEGRTITLTSDIEFTSTVIPNRTNYNDAAEGEEYYAQLSATGIDPEGNKVYVYWVKEFVKAEERELDSLDWYEDITSVELED